MKNAQTYLAGKYDLLRNLEKDREHLRAEIKQLNNALFTNQEMLARTIQQIEAAESPDFTLPE